MSNNQAMQEIKTAFISDSENIQNLAKIQAHIEYLVTELNKIEEEEFQSQLMAHGNYMIDEDDASHSCHEHVPDTIILERVRKLWITMRRKKKRIKLST
jgi:hypothetical protein